MEFLLYNTPGPHGLTPRDIDRRWSLAMPLEKELLPFEVLEFEPISDYAWNLFRTYRELRAGLIKRLAAASEQRAQLANRFRRSRTLEAGMSVVYRDPRAKSAGGRTAWRPALSEPCSVISVSGNRAKLKKPDGSIIEAHVEDIIVVPAGTVDTEAVDPRPALDLQPDDDAARRSPGQTIEEKASPERYPHEVAQPS